MSLLPHAASALATSSAIAALSASSQMIAGRGKAHPARPVGSRLAAQLEAGAQQECTIELAHPRQQAKVCQQYADHKAVRY